MKASHRKLIVFYAAMFSVWTFNFIAVSRYSSSLPTVDSVPERIIDGLPAAVVTLSVIFLLNGRRGSKSFLSSVGFRRSGLLSSFLWANALLLPIMVSLLGMLLVAGPQSLVSSSGEIPIPSPPLPPWYPLLTAFAIALSGIVSFPVLQAFPYESLTDLPRKYVVPLIAILWSLFFDTAFLTGYFIPSDILFYGLLFTVAYDRSRNSIGLVAAYTLAEEPLFYTMYYSWGLAALESDIVIRTLLSLVSACFLVIRRPQRLAPNP